MSPPPRSVLHHPEPGVRVRSSSLCYTLGHRSAGILHKREFPISRSTFGLVEHCGTDYSIIPQELQNAAGAAGDLTQKHWSW